MFRNIFVLSVIFLAGCSTTQNYKGIYVSNTQVVEINLGEVIHVTASPAGFGVALPIVSVLANPAVCKFSLNPIESKKREAIEKINAKI